MKNGLQRSWDKAKRAIMKLWGDEVDEADLERPMNQDQLCEYFGEKCQLSRKESEERLDRVLREIAHMPPGV